MTNRERWIVYPLLFMTLGIALRDKIIPPAQLGHLGLQFQAGEVTTHQIRCNTLFIDGPNGKPVVIAGTDANTGAGTIKTLAASGIPQVRLFSNDVGGVVTTIGRLGKLAVILGDTGHAFGVFAELPEAGQLIPLVAVGPFANKPAAPKPPKGPAAQPPDKQPQDKPSPKKPQETGK